jgi:hypothetical protein
LEIIKHIVKQVFGATYRPQFQGYIERFNQTLKRMLYSHMTKFKMMIWKDILQDLVKNYNDRLHSSTGFTPSHLHFANEVDIEKVRNKLQKQNLKLIEKVKLKNSKHKKL